MSAATQSPTVNSSERYEPSLDVIETPGGFSVRKLCSAGGWARFEEMVYLRKSDGWTTSTAAAAVELAVEYADLYAAQDSTPVYNQIRRIHTLANNNYLTSREARGALREILAIAEQVLEDE